MSEYNDAALVFQVVHEYTKPGIVHLIGEADVGWRCEVVVTHVGNSRSPYEYLVSVLTPRRTCYGVNTLAPHVDYVIEKFIGATPMGGGEKALIVCTILAALEKATTTPNR